MNEVMPMYKLTEYSYIFSKIFGSLWQYYKDELYSNYHIVTIDFDDNNTSVLFNFKEKLNSQASINDKKDVEIMVPLKNLSSFFEKS